MNRSGGDVLRVEALSFAYMEGSPPNLDDVSLTLRKGSVAAILGPNGAGKTTLLHTLLGVNKPDSGHIEILGRDLSAMTREERSRLVGLVPQFEPLPFAFTVEEYALLGRAPHLGLLGLPSREDWEQVEACLRDLDLVELQGRPMTELSGGERQMVVLARALVQAPALLLLDEPLAHLDLSNQARILDALGRLAVSGVTMLFTTHDPSSAASVADEIILMKSGRILAAGPNEVVLTEANLNATYGVPVQVVRIGDRQIVLLGEGN